MPATAVHVRFEVAPANGREAGKLYDGDGDVKRTGTVVTATAHIVTAVIGSGVLSLAWAIAQLGWVGGPVALLAFAAITWFCSTLLADCYRSPDPITGKRNITYVDAVKANLGGANIKFCGLAQYLTLTAVTIAYIITTAISMAAIKRTNCFHKNGNGAACEVSLNTSMIIFASIQIVLCQIPNFHKLWWLSIMAATMSFAYSFIGLGLAIAKIAEGGQVRSTLTGVTVGVDVTGTEKIWRTFQALGNIACAFSYSMVLIEIQDTLKPDPPENRVMKRASFMGVTITTLFYMACGVCGYAAFGNDAPGNLLSADGFHNPFWLVNIGNICIAIHLIGAYQVFCQPIFQFVENWRRERWPENHFITTDRTVHIPLLGGYSSNLFRLVTRTFYVIVTTLIAMMFPFFNDFLGLVGSVAFWPLTVYFPVEMYISQAKIRRFSGTWTCLRIMSFVCLLVSIIAAASSIQGLVHDFGNYRPFKN